MRCSPSLPRDMQGYIVVKVGSPSKVELRRYLCCDVWSRVLSLAVPRWKRVTSARMKGGDPRTTNRGRGRLGTPGWQPKETASLLPLEGRTLETAWVASVHKRKVGPQTPGAILSNQRGYCTKGRKSKDPIVLVYPKSSRGCVWDSIISTFCTSVPAGDSATPMDKVSCSGESHV